MNKLHQHVLTFFFTINEINNDLKLLPNISLGFHMYDDHFKDQYTYENTINLLSSWDRRIPNYKCDRRDHLLASIGGLTSETSMAMATLLSAYKIPQVLLLDGMISWMSQTENNHFVFGETLKRKGIIVCPNSSLPGTDK